MSEEKKLNEKPSEEVAKENQEVQETSEVIEPVESTEEVPVEVAPEVAGETTETEVVEAISNTPEVSNKTELVKSGPLSEKIRVIDQTELVDDTTKMLEDKLKKYEKSLKNVTQDERTIGKVVAVNDSELLLDIGFKSEGVVSLSEFEEGEIPKVGDEIEVFVEQLEDEDGEMILSKRKADFMRVWQRVKEMFNNNEIIEGKIKSRIKGGMVVDIMGIDAFLPGSQLDVRPVTDFDNYVGKSFEYRIVKLSELRKNIVLSRKVLLTEDLKEKRDELLSNIKVGDELAGKVKNITDFGVFVDLGGLDGLLHITDLSWGRINHPREVVNLDQELKVKVIDYDSTKQRVSLGLKQLAPHPWEGIEQKYPVDSIVKGKIVNIANYGVFIELEKGVEGLIHISEISWTKHIKHPSEVYHMGEEVKAKVLAIDTEDRKISLGYKQLEPDPWENIDEFYAVDAVCEGTVSNIRPHGVFIGLKDGIDGFVKMEDMSWIKKIRHPKEIVKKGDNVTVKVLELSKDEKKIILGMKQVEDNPWTDADKLFVEGAIVEGEVKKIATKVVVVKLYNELEGIIPLSEFPKDDRVKIKDVIKKGDMLQLKVLELNIDESRIVLSRQQAISMPAKPVKENSKQKYMSNQASTGDKIDIPQNIINQIAKAEESKKAEKTIEAKAEVVKTVVEEKTIEPAKKTVTTNDAEKREKSDKTITAEEEKTEE